MVKMRLSASLAGFHVEGQEWVCARECMAGECLLPLPVSANLCLWGFLDYKQYFCNFRLSIHGFR